MRKNIIYRSVVDTGTETEADSPGGEPVFKELTFEIEQDYEACEFEIVTENKGNFEVKLCRENDDSVWTQNIAGGNVCSFHVKDVKKGSWNVRVTLAGIEEIGGREEGLTPEQIPGKVKVSVRAIDKTVFSVGNVEVARDIAGLTEYLKDDAIVVEWTDTSCGNVNISIIDAAISQILDRQTVDGRYYEFSLPALTEEITVEVVPAESEGIAGAKFQKTVKKDYSPEAQVLYEDEAYTNKDGISVEVTLRKPYSLLFLNNGLEIKHTGILAEGTYTFDIPVEEGKNDISAYVIDSQHNMRSTAYSIIRDSVKPTLTLDMEYDGLTTYDDVITVTGTVRDYESFTINEVKPTVTGDGSFNADYILKDGENILNIRAVDIAGNETLYKAVVVKEIKKSLSVRIYILPLLFFILIAGVFWLRSEKGKRFWQKIWKRVRQGTPHSGREPYDQLKNKGRKKKILSEWQKTMARMLLAFIAVFLLFSKVLVWGIVPSESMEPFLNAGDYVIVNGLAYVNHKPRRGDVIIFSSHEENSKGSLLIKRVIGVPGDRLSFADGYVHINNELVYEEYLGENIETNAAGEFEVGEGCYFVMGDNREKSVDSRFWKDPYLSESEIKGKLLTVVPVKKIEKAITSSIKSFLP